MFPGCTLLDMHVKCGCLVETFKTSKEMPEKNNVSQNAMLAALANNDEGKKAIQLLDEMVQQVLNLTITFFSIISACCHSQLVHKGLKYFEPMKILYMVQPKRVHCYCVIDLLD